MKKQNLSGYQYGFLELIISQNVTVDDLRRYKDVTLWSLLYRGYIGVRAGYVQVTQKGRDAQEAYSFRNVPMRKQENDLTERSRALLHVARLKAKRNAA